MLNNISQVWNGPDISAQRKVKGWGLGGGGGGEGG